MPKKKFHLLSPDGIELFAGKQYSTQAEVDADIKEWSKRFEQQGYYSSNEGRIPLSQLRKHIRRSDTPY